MKVSLFGISLLIVGIICPVFVHADTIMETNISQKIYRSDFLLKKGVIGETILSGALSTGRDYDKLFGFQGTADYRLFERFSVGLYGNLTFTSSHIKEGHLYDAALRFNYHILAKKRMRPLRYDLYSGLSFGSDVLVSEVKFTKGFLAAHLGFRYHVDAQWMTFVEVGTRNASIGLAYSFQSKK